MRPFAYHRPATVDETLTRLNGGNNGQVRPLAGGTDLLTLMKANLVAPTDLVDIKRLANLPKGITAQGDGLTLGALTTLSEIEKDPTIAQRFPLLAEAAGLAATPQLRNMATIGGNLLQRPRCWYFRNELMDCWLKGGDTCPAHAGHNEFHALFGGGPCYAVHPSDLASALLALDAHVQLRSAAGERRVPLADFFALPTDDRRCESVLADDELLLSVQVPDLSAGTSSTYLKAMDRKVWAFALVGVAAVVQMQQGQMADVRLVLSGVAPIPWRATAAEAILTGNVPSDALFAEAATIALAGAEMLEHNAYKVPLAQGLIRRSLTRLTMQESS
ncbi:MAG: xanthine dehydrogenase family protein subunit M [Caldilineaceae bacterium]